MGRSLSSALVFFALATLFPLGARAEVVTSTDISCLMHLEGVARRRALPLRVHHVAEILAGRAR